MKIHWQWAPNMTCAQEAGSGRRERPKKLTTDPTKVTCQVCIKKFSFQDPGAYNKPDHREWHTAG